MRVRLYEMIGPVYRSSLHHAEKHPAIGADLDRTRRELTDQFERQFAPSWPP